MTPSDTSPQDDALLARIAKGDEAAMKVLYERYASPLQYFVGTWLADAHEAADVVHEAMLTVWTQADRFRGQSAVKSWVFGIARHKAIDRVRANRRVVPSEPEQFDTEDDSQDPPGAVAAMQDADAVRACVDALSDAHRRAIHLAFFEDLPYAEIAALEDCPVGTVKSRILYAKKLVARCVTQRLQRRD